MKLILRGHNYNYAVEQTVASLLPGEESGELVSSLSCGKKYASSVCIYRGVKGLARCPAEKLDDSAAQKLVRTAIYRAVRRSGLEKPPWGSLTGVRPGKLMRKAESVESFIREYDVSPERAELCAESSEYTDAAEKSLSEKDVCLYVGIPFCPTRCAYCSFVSQSVEKSMMLVEPFFEALKKELIKEAEQLKLCSLSVAAIYFGGGTPTTLSAPQLDELCSLIEEGFDLSRLREFTVEAGRPDTITKEKLEVLKKHSVTRVSVNPQTMEDHVLEAIGRKHTAQEVKAALALVRQEGDFAVNMDLIAGLPEDSFEGFKKSFCEVLELAPENITVHTLSLKRGSRITVGGIGVPDSAEVGKMLDFAYEKLRQRGYRPYYLYRQKNMSGGFENTGWTLQGQENLYNICMMEEICSVIAAGAGGSTKLVRGDGGKNIRITAPKYPKEYIEQIEKTCSDKEKIGEFYGM